MWILLTERRRGDDLWLLARCQLPCCEGVPSAVVGRRVFEVAVLHHLGIQSTVGGIADVLEENPDELVAYLLFAEDVDVELCLSLASGYERCISLGIVGEVLRPFGIVVGLLGKVCLDTAKSLSVIIDSQYVAYKFLIPHFSSCPLFVGNGIFVGSCRHIGGEMPEVGVCGRLAILVVLCAIHHVVFPCSLCHNHRCQHSLMTHAGIVLRSPCDEIATVGHSEARSHIVHLEDGSISALVERDGKFGVHFFVGSPSGIVRLEYLSDIEKCGSSLVGSISHMHALVDGRRIEEHLVGSFRHKCCDGERR